MIRVLMLLMVSTSVLAASPTKEPPKQTPEASSSSGAEASANATQGQSQNTTLAQSIDVDERSIGIGLGAGSAHYTGDCVVPKKGRNGRTGFLERGFTLPLLRLDPAVEVDELCIAHAREMQRLELELERERIELERERLEIERLRLDDCFECSVQK